MTGPGQARPAGPGPPPAAGLPASSSAAGIPALPGAGRNEATTPALRYQRIALVDLLDRVLAGGVVISGEVRLSIADVDMISISLRALISSVSTLAAHSGRAGHAQDRPGNHDW